MENDGTEATQLRAIHKNRADDLFERIAHAKGNAATPYWHELSAMTAEDNLVAMAIAAGLAKPNYLLIKQAMESEDVTIGMAADEIHKALNKASNGKLEEYVEVNAFDATTDRNARQEAEKPVIPETGPQLVEPPKPKPPAKIIPFKPK